MISTKNIYGFARVITLNFFLAINTVCFALSECPEGSMARKIQLLWADKGLMQTFDCVKEGRREYILLLGDRGHAVAQAMIPDGGTVAQVVQFQEYDSTSVLRSSKKFGLDGQLQRLERFSATGILILRYRQDQARMEEFSSDTPGEKVRECTFLSPNVITDHYKIPSMEIDIKEYTESGIRLIEVFQSSKESEIKTILKSDNSMPINLGQVQFANGIVGVEQCFVVIEEKKLFGKFQFGNKKVLIPKENAYPLNIILQHLKSPRSEETKNFLERYESN